MTSETIVYEDGDLVALNKPSGLLTIPDRFGKDISLKQLLIEKYGTIFTVHRLDRDTSGLVVFAKNESSHKELSQLFEGREMVKVYQGLVLGQPADESGTIDAPITEHPVKKGTMVVNRKGKESITLFKTLEGFRFYSFLQFQILTGRTHQIRVHMKHLGHPIVCDEVYGDGKPVYISGLKKNYKLSRREETERPILSRLALHSFQLSFRFNAQEFSFEAPLPKDMRALLQQLRKS